MFLDSDLVIGIGNRFSDRHTGDLKTYCEGRKFIHINIEPSQIGLVFEPTLGIVSDAKLATEALLAEVKATGLKPVNPERAAQIAGLRKELARKTDYECAPLMPHRVFHEVNEAFDDETYFTSGCGITQIWSGQLQKINKAGKYLPSGGAGTLGPITGFANAISAPAVEFNTEGFILGVGAKMFTIAGPVIVYGVAASVVYGFIYWITTLF